MPNTYGATVRTPTTQAISATFTPVASNLFILTVLECQAGITGNYTVVVTQAP